MTKPSLLLPAALLGLAACGSSGTDGPPTADTRPQPETGAALAVTKLDPDQRGGVLAKAIRASGAPCADVSSAEHMEVRKGVMGWKAHCIEGTDHLIEIASDGTANVTSRRD